MRVACLGDSITEGSPYWNARDQDGDPRGQWQYWAHRLHPELEFENHGRRGQRTDEILARVVAAVRGADVLILQGGINDIAQGRSIEVAAANLGSAVERGRVLGRRVAVCDVLPWNNGRSEHARAIRELNALIHAFDVPVLPFHDTLVDPDDPDRMKAEWTNDDGDHPSLTGYQRLGELAFALP
jgi:lysophospholipase L1-like esterase